MLAVISLHGVLEIGKLIVNLLVDGHVDLGRCSPENNYTLATLLCFEVADVLTQRLNHLPTGERGLHIVTIKTLGVVLVEGGGHGHNLLQLFTHRINVLLLKHLGIHCCLIGVLRVHIPATEHDVV